MKNSSFRTNRLQKLKRTYESLEVKTRQIFIESNIFDLIQSRNRASFSTKSVANRQKIASIWQLALKRHWRLELMISALPLSRKMCSVLALNKNLSCFYPDSSIGDTFIICLFAFHFLTKPFHNNLHCCTISHRLMKYSIVKIVRIKLTKSYEFDGYVNLIENLLLFMVKESQECFFLVK